jgi:hypothetical protein
VPASTAASPEATKAVRVVLDVDVASHHVIAIPDAHDFDLRAIETRKHRPGDDLVDRPNDGFAAAKIEDAAYRIDERIELMSAEQDRDFEAPANASGDVDHALLMRGV